MLRGSIVFYWTDGRPPAVVAREARDAGVRRLAVKCGDSGRWWPQYRELAPHLDAMGIDRPAWAYCKPATLDGDARVAAEARAAGAKAYIADMEREYVGYPAAARLFGRLLRAHLGPDFPVYVTTFASPAVEPAFPWPEAAHFADGIIPQWYACAYPFGSMNAQIAASYRAVRAYGRPVLPAGPLYGRTTAVDVAALVDAAKREQMPAVLWWRYGLGTEALLRQAASALPDA